LLALGAGACSLSAPTMEEYASVSSSRGGSASTNSASGAADQGELPTEAGGTVGDGVVAAAGGADDAGSAGDPGVAGSLGTAGNLGTAGSAGSSASAGSSGTAGGETGSAGSTAAAGGGGTAGSPLCSDRPLGARSKWVASASRQNTPAWSVLDGSPSRWSTGQPQNGNEWLQIDFGITVSIRRINLQQGEFSNDYPRNYAVYVSDTSRDSASPVRASGVGSSDVTTTIVLPQTVSGRYLFIRQVGTSLSWWSVEEIEVSCFDG
jgi:hypothetical protein